MKQPFKLSAFIFIMPLLLTGCVKLALKMSPSLLPRFTQSIFEECDHELAKIAIPANLKLMEGLLKNDSENRGILTSLSMGFSGYSMLFVEADDPERASELYLRARDYGIRALGDKGLVLKGTGMKKEKLQSLLSVISNEEFEPLLWATIAWNAWINLNLHNPAALSQFGDAQACLERAVELKADYLHGLPIILRGTSLAALPAMFGGNDSQARSFFERAMKMSKGKFFFAQYYFARYYAVRVQDKKLFLNLIQEITDGNPGELKDVCLINSVIQQKAKLLKEKVEELFI